MYLGLSLRVMHLFLSLEQHVQWPRELLPLFVPFQLVQVVVLPRVPFLLVLPSVSLRVFLLHPEGKNEG